MAVNYELERGIAAQRTAKNITGAEFLEGQLIAFNAAVKSGLVQDLPREYLIPEAATLAQQTVRTAESSAQTPQDILQRAISEYQTGVRTPELLTRTFQAIWQERGERVGSDFQVTTCDRTQEEIAELEKQGRRLTYVPEGTNLVTLGRMFPQMRSWAVREDTTVTSQNPQTGWIDVEADASAPYRDTTEGKLNNQLNSLAKKLGRPISGMDLETYIVGSQDNKLFTGQYFDENTWSRLAGSRHGGGVVSAIFYPLGDLNVSSGLRPQVHYPSLGGRSEGVKKA